MASEVWTVCGSMSVFDDMVRVAAEETHAGRLVFVPFPSPDPVRFKDTLNRVHRERIDASVGVIVVSRGGYIGESTRGEIEYAQDHGKHVRYVDLPAELPRVAEDPIECDGGPYCSAERHYDFCPKAVQS